MFGVSAIVTMVVIGFDRYNVIVKGFAGAKINAGKVTKVLTFIFFIFCCCISYILTNNLINSRDFCHFYDIFKILI